MNRQLGFVIGICIAIIVYLFTRPFLFFVADGRVLLAIPAEGTARFAVRFIHSVQKTPVEEHFVVDEAKKSLVLEMTKYQSFGVGLPFLAEEGCFRQEGVYFILDHIGREFPSLSFRSGVGNYLTVLYRQREYPIYERVLLGEKIDLKIMPYYRRFL